MFIFSAFVVGAMLVAVIVPCLWQGVRPDRLPRSTASLPAGTRTLNFPISSDTGTAGGGLTTCSERSSARSTSLLRALAAESSAA